MPAITPLIILGGTFDPVHNGHLELANKLYDIFQSTITFMPTGIPPYKAAPKATNQQRLEMLTLAIGSSPKFSIDTREINAPEYWYSHKTLTHLRAEFGNDIPIYFVIGGDSLLSLHTWDVWTDLSNLTNFIVVNRDGYDTTSLDCTELESLFLKHKTNDFSNLSNAYGKFYLPDFIPQNVSSTLIRQRVKQHQDISGLVPAAVIEYIKQQQLYLD